LFSDCLGFYLHLPWRCRQYISLRRQQASISL
jgi:hypothetical protein